MTDRDPKLFDVEKRKRCCHCKQGKPLSEFWKYRDGYQPQCKPCNYTVNTLYKKFSISGKDSRNRTRRKGRENYKDLVIKAYGGRCACCGESERGFLTVDHFLIRGNQHRKAISGNRKKGIKGKEFYAWVVKNGFPPYLRVLCWNCNCGREYNKGICPHEKSMDGEHDNW